MILQVEVPDGNLAEMAEAFNENNPLPDGVTQKEHVESYLSEVLKNVISAGRVRRAERLAREGLTEFNVFKEPTV